MFKKIKRFFKALGPGFITGASDDDPSGIATYSQTGAQFGYSQLWTAFFSTPFMVVVQEMCGRIGLVTGQGLAAVIRNHYSKKLLYFSVGILLIANTINIGADLGAMAEAAHVVTGIPFPILILLITAFTLGLEIFVSYRVYAKFLKYLTLSLLTYVLTVFLIQQDWGHIAVSTFLPAISFNHAYILNIVAILGTTISPYLFFWQADEEIEEKLVKEKKESIEDGISRTNKRELKRMRLDTTIGMLFSNCIMFFIITTTASTLNVHGITDITSATQAAEALRPIAGDFASLFFALGIFGTGLLAVPVLAGSASYAVAESLNWKSGLYRKFEQAHGFYGIITIATLVGLIVNFTSIPAFKMLYYAAVFNGIAVPPLLILITLIANNKKIMGRHTNSRLSNIGALIVIGIMSAATLFLAVDFFIA
ncbi:MAG: Nramp family divalent metal transporter [Candidatus Kerfeldbacteria bacterium]|nr:Nramp family divalent metal transporter [Candidatus Kerfeldbacteria bacterium]